MPRRGNRALLNKREKAGQPHDNLLRAVPYRISGPECGLFADAQAVFCDAHRRDPAGFDHLLRLHEPLVAAGLSASVSEKSPQGRQAHLVAEDAAMVRGRLPAHPPDRALRHLGRARHAADAAAAGVLLLPRPCAAQEYLGQRRGRGASSHRRSRSSSTTRAISPRSSAAASRASRRGSRRLGRCSA